MLERVGARILYFFGQNKIYGAKNKKAQETKARKADGKGQPAEKVANIPSSINYSSFYGDEEIVDCEPESPTRYLCDESDISPDYEHWPAHGNGSDAIIQSMTDFPAFFSG